MQEGLRAGTQSSAECDHKTKAYICVRKWFRCLTGFRWRRHSKRANGCSPQGDNWHTCQAIGRQYVPQYAPNNTDTCLSPLPDIYLPAAGKPALLFTNEASTLWCLDKQINSFSPLQTCTPNAALKVIYAF